MKVLTYNVHGWQTPEGEWNLDLVTEVIAASGADLVGLNEVFHPSGSGARQALDLLAERLDMSYAFGATQPSDPEKHPPYGNAILSRRSILAHAAHHLSPQVSYGKRGMLEARVLLAAEQPLTVYVTHLDHRSEQIRLAQWSAANTWLLRDRSRPHLLLGDFNALAQTDYMDARAVERLSAYQTERSWPVPAFDIVAQVLKSGYVDAFVATGHPPASGATFPADAPERRIDYIFLPALWRDALRSCSPLRGDLVRRASDHLPVLADLDV